jgi:hypothetical protein
MSYIPSSGEGGLWSVIETVVVSNQATVDMELTGTPAYYAIHIDNLIPVDNDSELWLRFSVDSGSSFLAGASDYAWVTEGASSSASYTDGDVADGSIVITPDFGNLMGTGTAESLNGWVYIHNAKQTTNAVMVTGDIGFLSDEALLSGHQMHGGLIANIDEVDEIRLMADTGNLSSGTITLYGVG